jgi:hypothetical protein
MLVGVSAIFFLCRLYIRKLCSLWLMVSSNIMGSVTIFWCQTYDKHNRDLSMHIRMNNSMLLTPTYFYSWMLSRKFKEPSWSWSYGSWIYNYLSNQYLSPLTLWVRIPLRQGVLDTTLCDKVCQWLTAGRWLSPGTPVSSTNKTDRHDITGILLEVALNFIKPNQTA